MAGMYGSFGDIKKVVGVVAILLVASFFLGVGVGLKLGSTSPSQETLTQKEKQEIIDAINNAPEREKQLRDALDMANNANSNAAARGATATPSPKPASNESFEEKLKRQLEGANK